MRLLALVLLWLVVVVPTWLLLFTHSHADTVVASHDAVVSPNLDGHVRLDLGPYLPDVRTTSGGRIGVRVELGKTTASSAEELATRYATIAAQPDAEVRRVREQIYQLAWVAALRAAVLGLAPVGLWLLLGRGRRTQLLGHRVRAATVGVVVVGLVAVLMVQPWRDKPERVEREAWLAVATAFPEVNVPEELSGLEIRRGLFTEGTRRLVFSLFDTYETSKVFYRSVVSNVRAAGEQFHEPAEGETVAVLVSDRHDNIGMDPVARAAADAAGATAILDAGDDTSTGKPWEGFSLDSLDEAFEGYDARVAVSGNHDHGTFVSSYLQERGWTHLEGDPEEPFGDVRLSGVDDPRSSGLGNWRDEKGLTFAEVEAKIAEDVCALDKDDQRVATLLVHDANLGRTALARGCTDLVLAGHLHVQKGPTRVVGENGKIGYSYTNGTTGGAAFGIAVGSKLRRLAELTMITYRDGRPVGIQPVTVTTTGEVAVADYAELDLG